MEIRVTKSSATVKKKEEERNKIKCPECGTPAFLGMYHVTGLFVQYKVTKYKCTNNDCKCEYETRERI